MSISAKDISGGSGGSMDALELLANPEKLKERIKSFNDAEAAAKEQIALAGQASEIVAIREGIDEVRIKAEAEYKDLVDKANRTVEEANETAQQIIADAESDAATVEADAAEAVRKAEARVGGIRTQETAVGRQIEVANQRAKDLDRVEQTLQQRAEALDQREQELEGEKEKLAKVRELIDDTL